ncbi:MAG: hypothetical protein VX383_07900 [Chloroflexota bacterium]|jgi:hypothetical protein|nr:hypothetical protein [Chloroflexota bacterium]
MSQNIEGRHVEITDYAEELMSVPRAHVRMEYSQTNSGVVLTHEGNELVKCPLTRSGMAAAGFMSQAMGVELPTLNETINVRVSTGVLFRVITIAGLDFENDASFAILDRMLEEAELQRGSASGSE